MLAGYKQCDYTFTFFQSYIFICIFFAPNNQLYGYILDFALDVFLCPGLKLYTCYGALYIHKQSVWSVGHSNMDWLKLCKYTCVPLISALQVRQVLYMVSCLGGEISMFHLFSELHVFMFLPGKIGDSY